MFVCAQEVCRETGMVCHTQDSKVLALGQHRSLMDTPSGGIQHFLVREKLIRYVYVSILICIIYVALTM